MKVLGLSFGRAMQNSEILLKAALMGAESAGAEVSMIRMMNLNIKPCIGCGKCGEGVRNGGQFACVLKDDYAFVENAMMDCDALIVAAPVYVLGPTGQLKCLVDRHGPSHDKVVMTRENNKRIAEGKSGSDLIDPRYLKNQYAGLISVGGAMTPHWVSMGLSGMNLLMFPTQTMVVDQIDVFSMGTRVSPVFDDQLMERTFQLGRNVASCIGKPFSDVKWMGDEEGICPVCHCREITVRGTTTVECPLCGSSGQLIIEGDKVRVEFSAEQQLHSRLRYDGLADHIDEFGLMIPYQVKMMAERGDELPGLLKKYKEYDRLIRP